MNGLGDFFELVRVINLPDRKDRLRAAEAQLRAIGLPFAAGKVEVFAAERVQDACGFPSAGVRGCFLSHLGVLQDARARGVRNVLIAEDDFQVAPQDVAKLCALMGSPCDESWGVMHLGHILPGNNADAPTFQRFDGAVQTAHLYAVNAPVFDRLIAYLELCLMRPPGDPVGGPMHYDGALTMFREQNPDVLTLVARPSLASQRASRSDISFRSIERMPGVQQMMTAARAVRGFLRRLRA